MKAGDRVVCINTKPIYENNIHNDSLKLLVKDKVYTIEMIVHDWEGIGVILTEVKSTHLSSGYDSSRFRLVDDKFAESIIERIEQRIKQDRQEKRKQRELIEQ